MEFWHTSNLRGKSVFRNILLHLYSSFLLQCSFSLVQLVVACFYKSASLRNGVCYLHLDVALPPTSFRMANGIANTCVVLKSFTHIANSWVGEWEGRTTAREKPFFLCLFLHLDALHRFCRLGEMGRYSSCTCFCFFSCIFRGRRFQLGGRCGRKGLNISFLVTFSLSTC